MEMIITFIKKRFRKIYHFSVYLCANLCAKAIPFFLLPIITAYLLPSEYGIWVLFIMFVNLFGRIFQVGSTQHISRNYYNIDKATLANHLYNILIQSLGLTIACSVGVFIINLMPGDTFFSIPKPYLFFIPVMAFIYMKDGVPLFCDSFGYKKRGGYPVLPFVKPNTYKKHAPDGIVRGIAETMQTYCTLSVNFIREFFYILCNLIRISPLYSLSLKKSGDILLQ